MLVDVEQRLGFGRQRAEVAGQPETAAVVGRDRPRLAAEEMIYSERIANTYRFSQRPIVPYKRHILTEMVNLARIYGVSLAHVQIPRYRDWQSEFIDERFIWSEYFGADIPMIGIPPAKLFRGFSAEDVEKLYYNEHLNKNGREFFTRAALPAILRIYDGKRQ